MASTVGTSTTVSATNAQQQRKTFYANGYYWVFYSDGTNLVYRTSTDGTSWSSATIVRACTDGSHFDVGYFPDYNTGFVYYAYSPGTTLAAIVFRRGTISGNSITWLAEQTVQSSSSVLHYANPALCIEDAGKVHIGFCRGTSTNHYWRDYSNTNNDGIGAWTSSGNLSAQSAGADHWRGTMIALTGAEAYTTYVLTTPIYGRLYTAGAWAAEETATAVGQVVHSTTAEGDDVHLAYYATTAFRKAYRKRTYGVGWGAEEEIHTAASVFIGITISVDIATGDLYAFWGMREPGPSFEYNVYYSKKPSGGSWSAAAEFASNEDDLRYASINAFKRAWNNVIGVVWTKGELTGTVRFQILSLVPPVAPPKAGLNIPEVLELILR